MLNNPVHTKYIIDYGEISSYPEGYKENAGIFAHNNPWVIIGETVAGNGDRAWEYYSKICPAYTEDRSELHKVEPYVYCQMIAGKVAAKPCEAKNSWRTGTAAWIWYAITQYILGIKPGYDGLVIDPCIPKAWDKFTVKRHYRGADYEITVLNPDHKSTGITSLEVNGEKIDGNVIPLQSENTQNKITVTL